MSRSAVSMAGRWAGKARARSSRAGIELASYYRQRTPKIKMPHSRRGNIQSAMIIVEQVR